MSTRTTPQPGPTTAARGFLLVVLAALCWGTSGITGDVAADRSGLDPRDIAWHRRAIGAAVLLAVHLLRVRGAGSLRIPGLWRRLVAVGAGLATYPGGSLAPLA